MPVCLNHIPILTKKKLLFYFLFFHYDFRSTIAGHQGNRYDVLSKLISEAPDLVKAPNSRGENILLFLVQTVGRQQNEQRQHRPPSR